MNNNIESAIFVKFDVSLNFTVAFNKINEAVTTFCMPKILRYMYIYFTLVIIWKFPPQKIQP